MLKSGSVKKSIITTQTATVRCKVNPLMTITCVHPETPTVQPLYQSPQIVQGERNPRKTVWNELRAEILVQKRPFATK